ncbi:MAG TPA: hypothetical protein VLD19_09425, partial [Chitinophagaceae bacterium]|nr:hypothetical protein [Chitinophagaceae bacterium]
MARQTGIFPLKGSIDKVNFYQSRDGDFARKKAKIPLETLLFAPEFENSRKAGKVFGLASTASRLIRSAFSEMILAGSNRDMHNRVLAALQENAKGAERLGQLPFHQLSDFNINRHALFATVCAAPYSVEIKVPGKTTVSFPAFNPRQCLKPPPKSRITHFRLLAGTAVIDCEKHAFKKDV